MTIIPWAVPDEGDAEDDAALEVEQAPRPRRAPVRRWFRDPDVRLFAFVLAVIVFTVAASVFKW